MSEPHDDKAKLYRAAVDALILKQASVTAPDTAKAPASEELTHKPKLTAETYIIIYIVVMLLIPFFVIIWFTAIAVFHDYACTLYCAVSTAGCSNMFGFCSGYGK